MVVAELLHGREQCCVDMCVLRVVLRQEGEDTRVCIVVVVLRV